MNTDQLKRGNEITESIAKLKKHRKEVLEILCGTNAPAYVSEDKIEARHFEIKINCTTLGPVKLAKECFIIDPVRAMKIYLEEIDKEVAAKETEFSKL
jgi:hypothetical protein